MIKTLTSAFKNKDIRKKLLYTLMMLVVIRIGSLLPIPGVDTEYFSTLLSGFNSGDLSYLSAFTGGSFEKMSLFALSITPYITSSIIMQLLTIAIPKLEEMQKEGEDCFYYEICYNCFSFNREYCHGSRIWPSGSY